MARLARVVAVGIPHHVTQRANARRFILESDSDKRVYLDLLRHCCTLYELPILGYCLMSNHVHLVVTPVKINSLPLAMKNTHGQYASYWNASHSSSGHVWQGRYYSCPLDSTHLWRALLHRAKSRPRTYGEHARGVPVVQRRRSLRHCSARFGTRYRHNKTPRISAGL